MPREYRDDRSGASGRLALAHLSIQPLRALGGRDAERFLQGALALQVEAQRLGRTLQAIPFSAPDGRPTQLFFLICCEDERIHLHTLARLCMLAVKTKVVDQLFDAPDATAAYDALVNAERTVLPPRENNAVER